MNSKQAREMLLLQLHSQRKVSLPHSMCWLILQPEVMLCFSIRPEAACARCQSLWYIAECHLYREKFSSPLPLYFYLVSVSYCIFSWPRSWLPEKRLMDTRGNSCMAALWNLEGDCFKRSSQAVHEKWTQGLVHYINSSLNPIWGNSMKPWSRLNSFWSFPQCNYHCYHLCHHQSWDLLHITSTGHVLKSSINETDLA